MKLVNVVFTILLPTVLGSCNDKQTVQEKINYSVMTVAPTAVTLNEPFSATIKGRQDIEIHPQISGTITKVCGTEGLRVKRGQPLFVIDQVSYRAALQTASANVAAAKSQVETAKLELDSKQMLFNENVVSDYDLATARNAYNVALAQQKQAEAQELNARNSLSYTMVKSPAVGLLQIPEIGC